ncbi:MAG: glycosyltransferase [Acidobacteriia bacterium]|nr:glycosyltransferase [Terriglobia bacterium]
MTNSFDTGGSERQFVTLAGALDRESFRVHLGCIQKTGGFLPGLEGTAEFPLGGNLYGPASWRTRYRLGRYLRRYEIAIAHAFDFYTNLALIPAARLSGIPVVIGSQRQMGDLLSSAKAQSQIAAFRFCDRVVCNSQAAANRLVDQGVERRRVVLIGNGLSPEVFLSAHPALPPREGLLRVGMVARMNTRSKNHRLFLHAAARIAPRFPGVEFTLVGDGPLRAELESEAQVLGLGAQALFLGDRRDVPAVLTSLDITVLPSDSESLSNAILESMAAGVPVIASDVGGNSELVGQGRGILVEAGSEQGLAEAMTSLLIDADRRRKIGKKAKEFAQANFTIENMRRRHEELYGELLEEKNWRADEKSRLIPSHSGDERTRVAIVAASLRYVGGQSAQADLLVKNWRNDPAIDARLVAIDPPLPTALQWIERLPGLRTVVRQPLYVWELWKGLREADIAHIFSASYWSFLIAPVPAWLVGRLLKKKILIHYHSGEARDHLQRFRSARPVLSRADKLVVPSGYLVNVFREFALDAEVVPNIVDLSQFPFRERKPLRPHLVCTRGFHPYYGVDVVVRAFGEIQKSYPEARLDLVGSGPDEPQIRALVGELGLSGVHFLGVVSREAIGRYYDQADVFINASRLDNMPVSVLEAFAAGTPVVSTAPEGMRYLVEDGRTGLLCEPDDPAALARNVVRMLRDPKLASCLAANAREQSKRYDWNAVREQWLAVYDSLHRGTNQLLPAPATSGS